MGAMQQSMLMVAAVAAALKATYVSESAFLSSIGAITMTLPEVYIKDDVLILLIETANQAITTPSGWTQVTNSPQSTGTAATAGGVRLGVFYRVVNGTIADFTIADTGNHQAAQIFCYRKADTTTPIDVSTGGVLATAGTTITLPTATTTVNNVLVLLCVGSDYDFLSNTASTLSAYTNTNLTNIAERGDSTTDLGVGGGIGIADGLMVTAGATGTSTVTNAASVTAAAMTVGLRPVSTYPAGRVVGAYGTLVGNRINAGTASAQIQILIDGGINHSSTPNTPTDTINDSWYDSVTTGIGNSHWVRTTLLSGSLNSSSGTGTWLDITFQRSYQVLATGAIDAPASQTASLKFEFATDSAGTNIVAVSYATISAQVDS